MTEKETIDVNFSEQGYPTGDLGRTDLFGGSGKYRMFADAIRSIPRTQWEGIINDANYSGCENLVTRIFDQGPEPSCTSNATSQATEITQAKQFGKDKVVHLSAISLYKRVGGPRSGSSVNENLDELSERGIVPLDNPENKARFKHTMSATGYGQRFPDGWEETAKLFRGHEWFDIRGVDQFITALLLGMPVVYGRSGHAICAVRALLKGNDLYVRYANSWKSTWGHGAGDFTGGFGLDSERMIRSGASWAFALRSVVIAEEVFK